MAPILIISITCVKTLQQRNFIFPIMYNIKQRQIEHALKYHKERPNLIELIEKSGIRLTETEKDNILIFGDIRGPYYLAFENVSYCYDPHEFSDYNVLFELLSER